jgi:4a-hydroxytetrahydrobiopterin dehydratase
MQYESMTAEEFDLTEGLDDWRFVLGAIHAVFRAGSFPAAAALVVAIAEAAEVAMHHPDIDVRYPDRVSVTLVTHATGGITDVDVDLARQISSLAAASGAAAEPAATQAVEFAIDTIDADVIRPFWRAVLGYGDDRGTLVDPAGSGPAVWFQQLDEPRPVRNRIHIDVSVPHDVAERRVAEALAAGGTLVSDRRAPAFWVLADADGNEACICTWQDRS